MTNLVHSKRPSQGEDVGMKSLTLRSRRNSQPAGKRPQLRPASEEWTASKVKKAAMKKPPTRNSKTLGLVIRTKPLVFTNGYNPTPQPTQKGFHFPGHRGNAPGGLSDDVWDKAYNCADSYYHKGGNMTKEVAEETRLSGKTRAKAIKDLINKGLLPPNFVDGPATW